MKVICIDRSIFVLRIPRFMSICLYADEKKTDDLKKVHVKGNILNKS